MHITFSDQLRTGIHGLNLTASADVQQRLLAFLHFLQKWNQAYNLTAIRSLDGMITHHLLDSLSLAPYIIGDTVLDVGTGAGFPGVPLAFYYPDKNFFLLDSNGKKIRFLLQAQAEFALKNIIPIQERLEKLLVPEKFDVIICRAVGEMCTIIQASRSLLKTQGRWLFMKGVYPEEECHSITQPCRIHEIFVPGVDAKRHVVVVENV